MQINADYIKLLIQSRGWSQNELARRACVGKGSLSRCLNRKRGVGRKLMAGLLRVFPDESVESLLIPREKGGQDAGSV